MALTNKRRPSPIRYIFEYIARKRSMAEAVTAACHGRTLYCALAIGIGLYVARCSTLQTFSIVSPFNRTKRRGGLLCCSAAPPSISTRVCPPA
jgi:hypothetical protein